MITTEVFAVQARGLLRTLDELAEEEDAPASATSGMSCSLELVDEGGARAFELDGYWRDVGTIESWPVHMELLADEGRR